MTTTDQAPILGANYVPNTPDPAPTPTVPTPTEPTDTSTPPPAPTTNLKPGSTGSDVGALQSYLVQMGYLTPDQVGTGSGTYGPQTTAAVAKMQQDLGVNAGNAKGFYGPQTQAAISQKYNSYFQSKQGTSAPDNAGLAKSQITAQTQQSSDPIFGALTSSFQPIMDSLTQVMSNINNPALTGVSLQQEYNDLAAQYNLPGMNAQLMNMQNVMNGTTDDIRSEITKSGGTATESQVMGLSAARNTVIQKQYNALATQYQSAQQNVQNMMQYAASDQSTQLQRDSMTASIAESMGSIQQQMLSMSNSMKQNAVSSTQYNVSQMGYKGLAQSANGDPTMLSNYENLLNLAPGTLSDPTKVAAMDTYKDQSQQLASYKAAITAYNAGYGGSIPGTSSGYNQAPSLPVTGGSAMGSAAVQANNLIDPNAGHMSLQQATGLSVQELAYIEQGQSALTRMPAGQQKQLKADVDQWFIKNGIDQSTFQSQYKAYNDTLSKNISRFNNTQIAEGEVSGTLANLNSSSVSAGLGNVNIQNVGKVLSGQQVNDSAASEYAFYFNDLKNSLAYFYAAQQGKNSPDVVDNQDAANVIVSGLSSGGVTGLQAAVTSTTAKMQTVLSKAVDTSQQQVWSLFGAKDKYVATGAKGSMNSSTYVATTLQSQGLDYNKIISGAQKGQIAVIDNATGHVGYVPAEEFDASKYTRM